ncbi:MAG: acriflavin resistance protein, partial [Maricaulis sp.]|nr:acriflavin resistance protein [Maricaulis sp.]
MSTLFYRYPRLTLLSVILLIAAGLGAFLSLGRQEDPSLTERFGTVVTVFPGASAERVEALVTEPLEEAIHGLAEINETSSNSRSGISVITLQVREDLSVTEVDQAWTLIRERVASVQSQLPAGALPSQVERQYVGAATMIVALSWNGQGEENPAILSRLADELEARLQNLSGTEKTEVFGAVEEEVRVEANPDELAALGLSIADLARLTARADSKSPAGELRAGAVDLSVEVAGEFDSLDRIRDIPVAQAEDGTFIRLADIATIEKSARDPARAMAVVDGRRSVLVAAYLQPELRVDHWSQAADTVIADFAASLPGIRVDTLFRQGDYVDERLHGLAGDLAMAA